MVADPHNAAAAEFSRDRRRVTSQLGSVFGAGREAATDEFLSILAAEDLIVS